MDEPFTIPMTLPQYLLSVERKYIEDALRVCRCNETATARYLGVSYRTLRYRLQKLKEWSETFTVNQKKQAWSKIRIAVLAHYNSTCQACGATAAEGAKMNVEHILPRERYPWLAFEFDNLQVLCAPCNKAKGQSEYDFRAPTE